MKIALALAMTIISVFGSAGCKTIHVGDAPPIRDRLTKEIGEITKDKTEYHALYLEAQANDDAGKKARNKLITSFVVPIQNYHEVMNNDIFVGATVWGSGLDIVAVAAAAIATAVVPAGTKTWWAAVATIAGGSKLALSKNILQEKSANVILATMISEREVRLAEIRTEMLKPTDGYPVDTAIIDLNRFLNTGSLDKSAAKAEANAVQKADDQVKAATAAKSGG